jgi:hypothetical protein
MERTMTPDESLHVIESMIQQAKQSFHRMSFYFLLWGFVLLGATLFEYFMASTGRPYGWGAWPVLGTVAGIASGIRGAREGRRVGVSTAMDRVFAWLWSGFTITLVLLIAASVAREMNPGPLVMVLTGLPTFVTGMMIRFRPLVVGGLLFWAIGTASFFVDGTTGALLFAVAMVFGYIIPGLLLKRQEDGLRTA